MSSKTSLLELKRLFAAIAAGDQATALRLLEKSQSLARLPIEDAGAYYCEQINHHVYGGDTPLHLAAAAYDTAIATQLVANGADLGPRNRRGAEPLHYAADGIPGSAAWSPERQYSMVEFLIRAGANPDSKDKSGVAPLHRAVRTRCTAAVQALLANGADPLATNQSGSTPLHLAVQSTGRGGSGSVDSRAEQKQIIRILLDHGAKASDTDAAGKSVVDCVRAEWIHALLE